MTQPLQRTSTHTSHWAVTWLLVLYVLFVVYGSLVPLTYVDRPLVDAVQSFKNIPFLVLGIESRADWVANGVLYVPVGFLTAAWLTHTFQNIPRVLLFAMAAAFSVALAIGIEFTQLFFPPRTVSLNDIMAECIGSLIGVALATRFTGWLRALLASFFGDSARLIKRALEGYAVAYIAFSLFPYDLLLSWLEVLAKVESDNWGWWLAGNSPRPMLLGFQLLAEAVLMLPFGFLLTRFSWPRAVRLKKAVFIGAVLGVSIEVAQFFIASGISQGVSVFTRSLGLGCGVALARHSVLWKADTVSALLRRYTLPLAAAYLLAMLEINGWLTTNWQGLGVAAGQFEQLSYIPFYYHYFTTEAKALFSLGAVSLSYVPIGVLAWAHQRSPGFALVMALLLATCIELGKLFLPPSHPDLTNLLLACMASGFTVTLLRQFMSPTVMDCTAASDSCNDGGGAVIAGKAQQSMPPVSLRLFLCLLATGIWVINFPAFPWAVGMVLTVCAVAVWLRPVWALAIIPAALPVFDLAPWSGRFFLDEFDALLMVCLAVAYSRGPPKALIQTRRRQQTDLTLKLVGGLVTLSFVISLIFGLQSIGLPDANSFNSYFSPYNALRIVKGAAWAALLIGLFMRFRAAGIDAHRPFAWGMVVGLVFTVAVIFWERVAFSEFWNFSDGYRVTAPFSASHTGGAYVDCYLAAAIPFLMVLSFEARRWPTRVAGAVLMLAAIYALMVTFSRGGYLSLGVAVGVVLLATLLKVRRFVRGAVILVGMAGAIVLIALPIFNSGFAQARFATTSADMAFRQAHWQDALAIRDPDWLTSLFGMGLGRFPETKYWRSTLHPKVGTYQLNADAGNTYLRLDAGDPIGLDQIVAVEPGQNYLLELDVRANKPATKITVNLCEKSLLTSANCISPTFDLGNAFGAWRSLQAPIDTSALVVRPWHSQRPVKLTLSYAVAQSTIDMDNVKLLAENGSNLLRNGDFTQGLDHWFLATTGTLHAHWRTHSLFYSILFDQGWFGVVTLGGLFALALGRAARKVWLGDALSAAPLAALSGFLVGGLFDAQIDAPRFLLLLLLLVCACLNDSRGLKQPPDVHAL